MFEYIQKYKNILLGIVIVVLLFAGYSFWFGNKKEVDVLTSTVTEGNTQSPVGNKLLLLLIELKSIRLNDNLFQDPTFQNLKDFGQPLIPEPSGRRNPFAPVDL